MVKTTGYEADPKRGMSANIPTKYCHSNEQQLSGQFQDYDRRWPYPLCQSSTKRWSLIGRDLFAIGDWNRSQGQHRGSTAGNGQGKLSGLVCVRCPRRCGLRQRPGRYVSAVVC